jgi:hypothetical protein
MKRLLHENDRYKSIDAWRRLASSPLDDPIALNWGGPSTKLLACFLSRLGIDYRLSLADQFPRIRFERLAAFR